MSLGLCNRKPQQETTSVEHEEERDPELEPNPQFHQRNESVHQHVYDVINDEEVTPNIEPYCSTVVQNRSHRNPDALAMFDNHMCNLEVHPNQETSIPEVFENDRYNRMAQSHPDTSEPVVFENERYESAVAVKEAIATMSDSGL